MQQQRKGRPMIGFTLIASAVLGSLIALAAIPQQAPVLRTLPRQRRV